MLNMSGLSGAPWGTPADGVKGGPMYEEILMRIFLFRRKLERSFTKRGSGMIREKSWISLSCHTRSNAPLMSRDTTDTLYGY